MRARKIFKRFLLTAGVIACGITAIGSRADAIPNVNLRGPAAATDAVAFSVHLPLRNTAELDALVENQSLPESPIYHHWITPAQFRARYGPDPAQVSAVLAALQAHGLQATRTSTQLITVRGTAAAVEGLLSTKLGRVADRNTGKVRIAALTPYVLPAVLRKSGAVITRLHAFSEVLPLAHPLPAGARPQNRYGPKGGQIAGAGYFADDLKQAYTFPTYTASSGSGVSIAIVDGTSDFSDVDLALYLQNEAVGPLKVDLAPAPKTQHILLGNAVPFDPNSGDSEEANLDSQQVALTAPGALLTSIIASDDSDDSFMQAFAFIDDTNAFDIVSFSYTYAPEVVFTPEYEGGQDLTGVLKAQNELFEQGNAQGITFVEASGDRGALSAPVPGYFNNAATSPPTVYPSRISVYADFPNAVLVGGGDLTTSYIPGSYQSTYVREQGVVAPLPLADPYGTGNEVAAFFAASGGKSVVFSRPNYQRLANTGTTGRAVPDVGGEVGAYTLTGSSVNLVFDGAFTSVLGTSASAPDFAGLLAVKASYLHSRLGLENPDIYDLAAKNGLRGIKYFHSNNAGDDGVYSYTTSHYGYNFIYGVGSLYGANFVSPGFPLLIAGNPQTPSNP